MTLIIHLKGKTVSLGEKTCSNVDLKELSKALDALIQEANQSKQALDAAPQERDQSKQALDSEMLHDLKTTVLNLEQKLQDYSSSEQKVDNTSLLKNTANIISGAAIGGVIATIAAPSLPVVAAISAIAGGVGSYFAGNKIDQTFR